MVLTRSQNDKLKRTEVDRSTKPHQQRVLKDRIGIRISEVFLSNLQGEERLAHTSLLGRTNV